MAKFRVCLSADERRVVDQQRRSHSHEPTRRKMETLWLLHHGLTQPRVAQIVGVGLATVQRYVAAFRRGGLDELRRWGVTGSVGPLAAHRELLVQSFREQPVCTAAQAADRMEQLTGIRRGPTQTRALLKSLGLSWRRVSALPIPPKKVWPSTSRRNSSSWSRS